MSSRIDIRVANDARISLFDPEDEIRTRFREVKHTIQHQSDREINNRDVMDILLELYWLHHEREPDHTEGVYL